MDNILDSIPIIEQVAGLDVPSHSESDSELNTLLLLQKRHKVLSTWDIKDIMKWLKEENWE
ncbi:unnamed protein product [Dovyalis caffra]|uniref:Uncharacterized protein n=1 Tax=Dovyalis caffra TaxID=77055 RepID=A0AAV1S300_9ROSI|nr:unnamed protein product [Dovyalis caffra]